MTKGLSLSQSKHLTNLLEKSMTIVIVMDLNIHLIKIW